MEGKDDFISWNSSLDKVGGDPSFGPVFFDMNFVMEQSEVQRCTCNAFALPPAEVQKEIVISGLVRNDNPIGARGIAL